MGAVGWLAFLVVASQQLDNGLGLVPPMGWNSWNKFGCAINETLVMQTVDNIIASGLAKKGYRYINLDDCWQISRNLTTGRIIEDKSRFPSGIAALARYVHSKGLLFGLYSDAGTQTCQGRPGSYLHESIDAQTYAEWEVDFLKYDNCHNQHIDIKLRYRRMQEALNATGRPIYFSMCEWGLEQPWTWAQSYGNSWRTTIDIKDAWVSILHNLEAQAGLSAYSAPGAWNDPDMLEVGNGGLSFNQYQSHFALWALLKSPLLIGCDVSKMSAETLTILGNEEVISISQDPLGRQGDRLAQHAHIGGYTEIWGGPLSGNRFALVLFNRSSFKASIEQNLKELSTLPLLRIRDALKHRDVDLPADGVLKSGTIESHGCEVYIVTYGKASNAALVDN